MLKLYQLKKKKKILNLNKTHTRVSLSTLGFISIFFITVLTVSVFGTARSITVQGQPSFGLNNIFELYKFKNSNNKFAARHEINSIVINKNITIIIDFYTKFTNDRDISSIIIKHALDNNIPINVAFAQAWEESRFNPKAVSDYNSDGSRDWGLFQLNDGWHSYTEKQLFDANFNSRKGMQHLAEMIDRNDGNIITGLYCYNAGFDRINVQNIIPKSTVQYVQDILEYEDMLNIEFNKIFVA